MLLFISTADARKAKVAKGTTKATIGFRSTEPKTFSRALTQQLNNLPPDSMTTLTAQASVAEILFRTQNYREAAQIYLQLTEAPLADLYKLSSFQFRLAECFFHMGLYGESYDQFSRVRQSGHKSLESEAILGMAMAALAVGNRSGAQAHLDILLLENVFYRDYRRSLYPLGIMLFQNEQYKRSLVFFEKNLEDPVNLYFAGISQRRSGNLPQALAYFQQLTQKFPGTVWAQRGAFEVAESYYLQQDYQLAYQSFQKWLQEYPNGTLQLESHYRLASADLRRKNYKNVVTRLEPLLRMDMRPSLSERMRHLVVESWVQMDQIELLVNYIRRKGRARDRNIDDSFQLMWALAALGKHQDALSATEIGLTESYDPELTPKILLIQGYSHDYLGRPAESLAAYQTVVDRFPGTAYAARALHLMALAYVRANRWQELVTHVYHHWSGLSEDIRRDHPEVEFWITEGQLSLGNFDIAKRRYRQFISVAPDHPLTPFAYLGLSVALAQDNELDAGLRTLQQFAAIAKQKNNTEWMALATMQSGNIHYNQKSYEQAIGYFRAFQKDYSTSTYVPQALYQEGQSLYRLEYYSDAVEVWTKLASKHPNHALTERAMFQSARTLFDLGNTTAAVKGYQVFIVKHPNSPRIKDARLQLAHAYYNGGDYKNAIPKYQEFLSLYPSADEVASVQDFLQISYVQVGKTDAELEKLTQGQAKSQVLADLYWERGAKAFNNKAYKDALSYFEKLLIEFPASPLASQAAFYRAETLYLTEKYPEASAGFKNFLAQYPNDEQGATALFHLGVSLFNQNLFEESALTFESLVHRYPDDPLAQSAAENIPMAYARLGRSTESEQAYENLLNREKDPKKRAVLLLQMGEMREKNGQAQDAIRMYEQVSPSVAEYGEAMYAVGSVYARAGQIENEIQVYQRLINFSPKDDPFRISGLSRLAELYISQGKAKEALSIYQDVARNSTDQTALVNAKARIDEIQKVLQP